MDKLSSPTPAARALLALLGSPASAGEPFITTWTCRYQEQTRLACRLAPADDLAYEPGENARATPGADALLPSQPSDPLAVMQRKLREPGRLRGRIIVIPMFSSYESRENARELADAVMCSTRLACRVNYYPDIAAVAVLHEIDPARD